MPRRPRRSQVSSRPNRKEISRRLDDLTDDELRGLPNLSLPEILSHDLTRVRDDPLVVRLDTGELRRVADPDLREVVTR